jgi:uncharacterized membrane protein
MHHLALRTGLLLIVIGAAGTGAAMTMVDKWWYAAIPAMVGALIAICGLASRSDGLVGRLAAILAVVLAVVGIVGSFMPSGLNFSTPGSVAFVSSIFRLLTITACASFIALALRAALRK